MTRIVNNFVDDRRRGLLGSCSGYRRDNIQRLARITAIVAVLIAAALAPATAAAHPLGNFSINHLVEVRISQQRIDLHYVLDQAEIPTFQERGLANAQVLTRKRDEVRKHLTLTVDGEPAPLSFLPNALLSHPPGQGGLPLTRVELWLTAAANHPHRVAISDQTFPGRVGWKAVVIRPGSGTDVRSNVPSTDPTDGLRSYPQDQLSSPLDQRTASFVVTAGNGSLIAPNGRTSGATTHNRSGDGFAGVFADAAAGKGVLLFLLFAAFAWGAIHALSPGHGKTMVAAYLVGTKGTVRHAVALGATVTITHTIGVFALGLVTLALSQYILPEQLYPWLNLASGLLVLAIGAGVLRSRLRKARRPDHAHHHDADHHHSHNHHDHSHNHHHANDNGPSHDHGHGHHHHPPDRISWKGLIAMGASAGLLPCPSALVVLLGAIAQHQIALGLLMIVVFSLGLASTITGLGIAVVSAGRITSRLNIPSRVTTLLPAVSSLVIVVAGLALTIRAVPQLS
jgi:nickel/cobalt transporter (NicO) family protein